MPVHGKYPVRMWAPNRALLHGSFEAANGASPTVVSGTGFTVALAAEGRWTVTLTDAAVEIEVILTSYAREVLPGSNAGEHVEVVVDQDTIDTNSFEIQAYLLDDISGANAPALDDQPGMLVSFLIVVRDTSYA